MALANMACLLARGGEFSQGKPARVLMMDWDLEAPGLHGFFDHRKTAAPQAGTPATEGAAVQPGLLELFEGIRNDEPKLPPETAVYEDAEAFIKTINLDSYMIETFVPGLKLIRAGNFDDLYPGRVIGFDWRAFYRRAPWFFRVLAERLSLDFDYVLMDSRTGLTDVSGICTMLLPEKLVVVFTPNRQSLTGVPELVRGAVHYRLQSGDLRPLAVYPLPSRIEAAESDLDRLWRYGNGERKALAGEPPNDAVALGYQTLFEETFREAYNLKECNLESYFNEVRIQHSSKYAYGEGLPVEEEAAASDRSSHRLSMRRSYETFRDYLLIVPSPWLDIDTIRTQRKIESLLEKGRSLTADSRFDEAFEALMDGVKLFEPTDGQEDPGLAEAIEDLAQKFGAMKAFEKAAQCLENALKIQERISGKESPKLIPKLTMLAEFYQESFAFDKAIAVATRALALAEQTFGAEHPKLVKLLQFISRLYSIPYLSRILRRCGHLSLAGVDPALASQRDTDAQLNLNAVYMTLLTRSPREQPDKRDMQDPRRLTTDKQQRSALEQLDRHQRLVLQGDPGSGKSTFVREQVKQAVESFAQVFSKCRVLVTSRTYAYQNRGWRLEGFAETVLAPFSDGQIRRFVSSWYAHTAGLGRLSEQDAAGRAELLKQTIFNQPTLYELAQRPLLLTLMASLHAWRGGDLPEKREQLYADAVNLLLNLWEQRRIRRDARGQPVLL